jgi:hypothetical protein
VGDLATDGGADEGLLLEIVHLILENVGMVQEADPVVERRPRKAFDHWGLDFVLEKQQFSIVDEAVRPFHHVAKLSAVLQSGCEGLGFSSVVVESLKETDSHALFMGIGRAHWHSRHEGVAQKIQFLAAFDDGTKA